MNYSKYTANGPSTLARASLVFIMDSPVFDLNLFDFENYIPEWENVSEQELVVHVGKRILVVHSIS